jgi:hypothetical protein
VEITDLAIHQPSPITPRVPPPLEPGIVAQYIPLSHETLAVFAPHALEIP